MTATLHTGWELTPAELAVLAVAVGSDTLRGATATSRSDRYDARDSLVRRGLLEHDEVTDPDLVSALRCLADPALEITARCTTAGLTGELAVGRTGAVLAVYHKSRDADGGTQDTAGADTVVIREIWAPDARSAARVLGDVLERISGRPAAADVPVARFPLHTLADRLTPCHDRHDVAAAFAAGGLAAQDASRLAAAVSTARLRTEIVALVRVDGLPTTSVGAIAVLDGPAGRVIAGPDLSVDGTPWTTFSPGTPIRLEQALGRLVATVPGADVPWDPPPGIVA